MGEPLDYSPWGSFMPHTGKPDQSEGAKAPEISIPV
jgi:hypothetical protein